MVCLGGSIGFRCAELSIGRIPQLRSYDPSQGRGWRFGRIRAESADAGIMANSSTDPVLVVVGGGAAGIFGAIRAKTVCPRLKVVVVEKGKLLSKVRISGGGRCNVTTGLYVDPLDNTHVGLRNFGVRFFGRMVPKIPWRGFHNAELI